jgi:hypothetical protein
MNTTIRSLNRGMIVVGAPLGGILADTAGYRTALWTGIAGLVGAALILGCSRSGTPRSTPPPRTRTTRRKTITGRAGTPSQSRETLRPETEPATDNANVRSCR